MDMNSLAHTKWECKYHLVFAPKYRRQIIYGKIKADVAQILSTLFASSTKASIVFITRSIPDLGKIAIFWSPH